MPPILTYSFLPGLVGSSASLHSSLAYHRCLSGGVVGGLTDIVGPFELHGYVSIAVVVGLYSFYHGESGKVLHKYNGGTVGDGNGVVKAC
jgi:hypothetical protein